MTTTLHFTDGIPPTLSYDVGSRWTGICLRIGNDCINSGTLTSYRTHLGDLDTRAQREAAVFAHPGTRVLLKSPAAFDLIDNYIRRLVAAGEWLVDVYGYLIPDGVFYVAVERHTGARSSAIAVARQVSHGIAGSLNAEGVVQRKGSAHQKARGGSGRRLDYYPPNLIGRRGKWATPDEHGEPVLRMPNEREPRSREDEQDAYAQAAWLHVDPLRRRRLVNA
jgi:hypothetical protein